MQDKCYQYWPEQASHPVHYGTVEVTLSTKVNKGLYVVRSLKVTKVSWVNTYIIDVSNPFN